MRGMGASGLQRLKRGLGADALVPALRRRGHFVVLQRTPAAVECIVCAVYDKFDFHAVKT
jgi:hypothetical protein